MTPGSHRRALSIVIGAIYPAAIQQFKVGPNEFQTEAPYIDRNIRATRSRCH